MKFIDDIKKSMAKSSEQNKEVRDKIKEIEFEERMKQAEIIARARIKSKADKKIASFNPKVGDKPKFFSLSKIEDGKGKYNYITGKYEGVPKHKIIIKKKLSKK